METLETCSQALLGAGREVYEWQEHTPASPSPSGDSQFQSGEQLFPLLACRFPGGIKMTDFENVNKMSSAEHTFL